MANYDWKIEPRDEDWSDDLYAYFLVHINLKRMAEMLNKEFKKDWWFKADFGQDYCWIVAENNNYPVRLFFDFEEGGWADMKRHYFDSYTYADEILASWHFAKYDLGYSFDLIRDNIKNYFKKFEESKKSDKKSMKEYRTVGFEQLIRDVTKDILESNEDFFDLGMCSEVVMTYDVDGRARITSNGDVDIDYLTLPTYAFSSGFTPKNKKLAKIFDDIVESNRNIARERIWDEYQDELVEIGITDEDDIEYYTLSENGREDLAEQFSEYEMDLEGTDLYTDVYCEITEVDEGFEFNVSMTVQDENGCVLVKDYKSNSVILEEDMDERDLRDTIESAIKEVTEQF